MASYGATIIWQRAAGEAFIDRRYSRAHEWRFDGGVVVAASSSPHIVPLPYSAQAAVDPEEAFVAALSSCHMLFFLHHACAGGLCVERYVDQAEGVMGKNFSGRLAMTAVTLKPAVTWSGEAPSMAQIDELHARAHADCFIANSVLTDVRIETRSAGVQGF